MAFCGTMSFFEDDLIDGIMSSCDSLTMTSGSSDTPLTPPRSPCSDYSSDDDPISSCTRSDSFQLDPACSFFGHNKDVPCDCCSPCDVDFPLLNDCMWSAGLFPADLGSIDRTSTVKCSAAFSKRLATSEVLASTFCVNPSIVSPYPKAPFVSRASSAADRIPHNSQHVTNLHSSFASTNYSPCSPPDEEFEDGDEHEDDSDESGEEVDVVSILPSHQRSHYQQHPSLTTSLVRELLVLPSSSSVLAQVTAMHNYSSSHVPYQSAPPPSMSSRLTTCSAPQSPATDTPRHAYLKRSASTPASPCPSSRHHKRARKSSGVRRTGSDSDDSATDRDAPPQHGGKRALHNVLERRRRDHLKSSFEALRSVVPAMNGDVRMPKVAILRRARDHLRHLCAMSQRLQAEHDRLRSLQQRWQYKLALLSRDSA